MLWHNRQRSFSLSPVPSIVWRWSIPLLRCSYRHSLLFHCRQQLSFQHPAHYQWPRQTDEPSHLATMITIKKVIKILSCSLFSLYRANLSAIFPFHNLYTMQAGGESLSSYLLNWSLAKGLGRMCNSHGCRPEECTIPRFGSHQDQLEYQHGSETYPPNIIYKINDAHT